MKLMTASERLFAHAMKDMGLKEVPGTKTNPRIKKAILAAADWLDPDDSVTAWCGCILGLWCFELGWALPKAFYRAINWREWGYEVDLKKPKTWQQGDVMIMPRPGGNHVTLFNGLSKDGKQVSGFGGNQSNQVKASWYDLDAVKYVRRGEPVHKGQDPAIVAYAMSKLGTTPTPTPEPILPDSTVPVKKKGGRKPGSKNKPKTA